MSVHADLDHIDGVLAPFRDVIGPDFEGYRNHVARMATFCLMLRACNAEEQQRIEVAACFHDIGLWTARTLDYLEPSVPPAIEYLEKQKLAHWSSEIREMILEHHRIRPIRGARSPLVELFRRGDLVDFSLGLVRSGLPAEAIREVKRELPNAGFHRCLAKRAARWFLAHPTNPAPMMKW